MTHNWTPPSEFVAQESKIPGITVYAPAPEETHEETQSFTCQHCGGAITYSAKEQVLTCPYCGQRQDLAAEQVGRAAPEFEFTLETMSKARYGLGEKRREIVCEACGAVVSVAPDQLTDTCAFCGSNRVLARDAVPAAALRPSALVPFSIDGDRLQTLTREWLQQGWMHPPALRDARLLRDIAGIYLPHWTFDTRVQAAWQAEVGYERTERYRRGGEWHTRTVIDWRRESGRVLLPIDDHLVVGTVLVSRKVLQKVMPFDLTALVAYEPGYLAGWQAKLYDIPLQEAWRQAKEEIREKAHQACYDDIHSSHVRAFTMVLDFADESWRHILLPVYLASYRFEGRPFQLMINGQTGKVAGQKPVAWLRVWLVIAALLIPGACLGLLGLLTLAVGGVGVVGVILGLVLFILGLMGGVYIFQQARSSEEV